MVWWLQVLWELQTLLWLRPQFELWGFGDLRVFSLKASSELEEPGALWVWWQLLGDPQLCLGLWAPQELLALLEPKALRELWALCSPQTSLGLQALRELQAAPPQRVGVQLWTLLQPWTFQEFRTLTDLSSWLEPLASLELWVPLALWAVLKKLAFPGL